MKNNSYILISLGCAKNTVDSESMAIKLNQAGYLPADEIDDAEFLIVNTCGFIQSSREESLQILSDLAKDKLKGQYLITAGCYGQRSPEEILEIVPEVDFIIGTRRWMDITDVLAHVKKPTGIRTKYDLPVNPSNSEEDVPRVAIQGGSAYLKIADGCDKKCAYCAIPLIKGPAISRPMEHIIEDALLLQDNQVKELLLIAQDTTAYGLDRGEKDGLATLLENLLPEIPDIPWVRILYTFPGLVTDHLIDLIAEHPQVLPYLDIPLQHASPRILKSMNRPSDIQWVYDTLTKMRKRIPELTLRTTFIVGYPGETDQDFQLLMDLVEDIQFDHLGAFTYSFENGTPAEPLGDPIHPEIKQERLEELMLFQENISLARNQQWIGKRMPILVEGVGEGLVIGRSFRDAPEIDGLIFAPGTAQVGDFVNVEIQEALPHDLSGKLV
jgi:ribosomal protein S12 methylthiotransferase